MSPRAQAGAAHAGTLPAAQASRTHGWGTTTMATLPPQLAATPVTAILTRDVATITADRPLAEVGQLMLNEGHGGYAVVDANGTLIGMISELDLIGKRGQVVGDVMSRGLISVPETATAADVATLMGLHGLRRVPVVRDGRLLGMVRRSELLRIVVASMT